MKIRTFIAAAALGAAMSLSASAQETTEPVATDSEGMSPDQQAKKEKKKSQSKQTQTWGGGPKAGALHEDWLAWIILISLKPKAPTPEFPTGKPAPADPEECAIKIQDYRRTPHRNKMTDEQWSQVQSEYNGAFEDYCMPG